MMCYALLKQIDKADKIHVELPGVKDILVLVQKKDLQEQLMHECNGEDVETGIRCDWSKNVKGFMTLRAHKR